MEATLVSCRQTTSGRAEATTLRTTSLHAFLFRPLTFQIKMFDISMSTDATTPMQLITCR
uniref:Uncharacterized protein n=1 Tax=Arundo donax TaxID=35708 RepID=A0A0A8XNL2_ARUDO